VIAYEKALPISQRSLEISEMGLGQQHPYFVTIRSNLALLYDNMGDYEKALSLYQTIEKSSN
jgi:tetratricopeptide (TPR) repeat protein